MRKIMVMLLAVLSVATLLGFPIATYGNSGETGTIESTDSSHSSGGINNPLNTVENVAPMESSENTTLPKIALSANESQAPSKKSAKRSTVLVAYFSRTGENYGVGYITKGNTRIIAEMIAEETGGNLFEIKRVSPYPTEYHACTEEAKQEQNDKARPELTASVENFADYDVIYLGYPNWWGDMPMPVYTFLESYDFSGKTVVPFCTHEGSGLSGTVRTLSDKLTGATVLKGLAISGTTAQNEQSKAKGTVLAWLRESKPNTAITDSAKKYREKMYPGSESDFLRTDPEFIERFDNFALDEVVNQDDLPDRTRFMAILATLIGCQGIDEFRRILPAALNFGVTPVEVKEITYQAVAYLGMGRVFPFLQTVNTVLEEKGVALPLKGQATTTPETRLEAGNQTQVDIFGERMRGFYRSGPEESRHINRWLADNCFGDYYTRTGLDYKQREMITFCFLAAQGGCEPQLTSHAVANMKVGNDKAFLIKIISQCLPYIGYPRSLNALRCVNEAASK